MFIYLLLFQKNLWEHFFKGVEDFGSKRDIFTPGRWNLRYNLYNNLLKSGKNLSNLRSPKNTVRKSNEAGKSSNQSKLKTDFSETEDY